MLVKNRIQWHKEADVVVVGFGGAGGVSAITAHDEVYASELGRHIQVGEVAQMRQQDDFVHSLLSQFINNLLHDTHVIGVKHDLRDWADARVALGNADHAHLFATAFKDSIGDDLPG